MRNIMCCLVAACFFVLNVDAVIVSAPTLKTFEKATEEVGSDDLVLFDVDETLIVQTDKVLNASDEIRQGYIDRFIKDPNAIHHGRFPESYLRGQVLKSMPFDYVEEGIVDLVNSLKQRNIKTLAFTKMGINRVGEIPSLADWRIEQLNERGLDFHEAFPEIRLLSFYVNKDEALYKSGVLFSNRTQKGPVLKAFLKILGWKPRKVLLLDNRLDYLMSVEETFKDSGIEFIGYHYTYVEDHPVEVDEDLAEFQYYTLASEGIWLKDEDALEVMKKNSGFPLK